MLDDSSPCSWNNSHSNTHIMVGLARATRNKSLVGRQTNLCSWCDHLCALHLVCIWLQKYTRLPSLIINLQLQLGTPNEQDCHETKKVRVGLWFQWKGCLDKSKFHDLLSKVQVVKTCCLGWKQIRVLLLTKIYHDSWCCMKSWDFKSVQSPAWSWLSNPYRQETGRSLPYHRRGLQWTWGEPCVMK